MKVLVIGGGGREHALVWKISQSPKVSKVYCAPGNAGISKEAEIVAIKTADLDGLVNFARKEEIDLTVVGPETPLVEGIVDLFQSNGLTIFGPTKFGANIEGSKAFAKSLMEMYDIPTASYEAFSSAEEAKSYIRSCGCPLVVKADGLCAGKGVFPCKTIKSAEKAVDLILKAKKFGRAGDLVVIEDFLEGEELSFIVFTDGKTVLPLASAQDHKALLNNDLGPNTGGMGAYSPAPVLNGELQERIIESIIRPIITALSEQGSPYRGVLYAGLIIDNGNPYVLEFNARFGDPETQAVLVRMKSDIVPILQACVNGNLAECQIEWDERPAVCVVMASQGYPGDYERGKVIYGLNTAASAKDVLIFHAGTDMKNGQIVTSGGRVLGVTGLGETIPKAIDNTYGIVRQISWEGLHYRKDIGQKALKHLFPMPGDFSASGF